MPNGDLSFEEFIKLYPQFDEAFIKTMMGKGLKIRVQQTGHEARMGHEPLPNPVYQGMSNTIIIPQHALGDSTVIEHEMAHALTDLDPRALRNAGFTAPQTFLGGIGPGVGLDSPGSFLKGLASLIAPNTVTRAAESFAISSAGKEAYPDFDPMGKRRQFDFMFKNKVLPEAQAEAESADRVMLQQASYLKDIAKEHRSAPKPVVPRMREPTTKPIPAPRRRGGEQEF